MSEECKFVQKFDNRKMYQYLNNEPSVFHCHHYATLYTKLALSTEDINGPKLLFEAMEESFYIVLKKYFITHEIMRKEDKVQIASDYFALSGMGKLKLNINSFQGGTAEMSRSHVDEGWIKKFGTYNKPINFIGQGYIAAAFSIINQETVNKYDIKELQSIVSGSHISKFSVKRK